MKNARLIIFLCLLCNTLIGQNTKDLFSLPGLSYVYNHGDKLGGYYEGTSTYVKDTIINNELLLQFEFGTSTKWNWYSRVEDSKVFHKTNLSWNDEILSFDFGMEVGDTISLDYNLPPDWEVLDFYVFTKTSIQLLDQRDRIYLILHHVENPLWQLHWVEGIGELNKGPYYNIIAASNLDCVRDSTGLLYLDEDFSEEECELRLTSDNQVIEVENFSLFPNPATTILALSGDYHLEDFSYQITDRNGIPIQSKTKLTAYPVDISTLPEGLYFLILSNGQKVITEKFIKLISK